jgi:hypothetical protein
VSFTPAPWTFAGVSESGLPSIEFGERFGDIWHLELMDVSVDDAHLICAAPDMYAILDRLTEDTCTPALWNEVQGVLRMARGEK